MSINKIKNLDEDKLSIANKELIFQNEEKEKRAAELSIANTELAFQNKEKEKRAAELSIANIELAFQNEEKEKRAAELGIANKELAFQNEEKEKRAGELGIANKELIFQNNEKEKRAAELSIANRELAFQNKEKEKRAQELHIANTELLFQNEEKEKRAAELGIANKELAFQNDEKEKRAAEKEKRAEELIIANKELAFQNDEKEKRAAELIIANKELAFQNEEKEKRAAELIIANKELAFQNEEKEKRAAELIIANKELAFQNEEKEKRAAELIIANKELLAFTYISSHDLQEPLRKIQTFVTIILENESKNLSEKGKYNLERMQLAAGRMQQLIDDLLAFSRISTTELVFEKTDLKIIINEVKAELKETIQEKNATIDATELCSANIIAFQFRQLMYNLISNALKFSNPDVPSHIVITGCIAKGSKLNNKKLSPDKNYCHITVKDNGIGFEPRFNERIFGVFQKLHGKDVYAGTGIGLAIVKKIVENHNGTITANGELNKGAQFDIYIPA
ncbi:sensor histidine kinase [Ferruginibacter sp.]